MAKPNYSAGKRRREQDKARRKQEKAERQHSRRTSAGIPIATADEIQGGSMMSIEEVMESVHGRPETKERSHAIPGRLFVGGLGREVTAERLRERFEKFGVVSDAFVVVDRDTGDSRGFGFVTMADRKAAAEAIRQLDGQDFDGRPMVVRVATERPR